MLEIARKCLAKNPEDRPTAKELCTWLHLVDFYNDDVYSGTPPVFDDDDKVATNLPLDESLPPQSSI